MNQTRSGHSLNPEDEVIFSLRDGFVWASWPGTNAAARLGRYELVSAMMRDFLVQDDLGRRLERAQRKH